MSTHGFAGVRIGGDLVALLPEHPVGVGKEDTPDLAVALVRCDGCRALTPAVAPVTYKFYDDDHYGRLELWYESRHAGACAACKAPFEIELSYTLTRYPGTDRTEFSLDPLEHPGRRLSGGTPAFVPADDLAAAAPAKAETPPLIARSSAECHLYMALNHCPCGEGAAPAEHTVVQGTDGLVAQYRGQCAKCGRARAFNFALDPEVSPVDAFGGGKPSRLICPGQFALHADRLAARWPADRSGLTDAQRAQAEDDLAWATRALEEVLKFVPAGGDAVPADAFTSAAGRATLAAEPGRFRKIRLQARLDAYRQLLAPPAAAPAASASPEPKTDAAGADLRLICLDVDLGRNRFAVGREDGTVIIADLATGTPQRSERLHSDWVSKVVFDGDVLWTAGCDGEVVAWDLALGEVRRRFDAGHGRVLALGMAGPDRLLTAGDDGNARLWDKAGGAALQVFEEKRFGRAYSVAATAGWIAIGYRDGHSGFWEPSAAGAAAPWTYAGHMLSAGRSGSPAYAIVVSPAGNLVAVARDRRVTLYTPGTWSPVAELQCDLACNDLQFDSKGEVLVGACSERRVRLWRRKLVEAPAHQSKRRQRRSPRPSGPVASWDRFGDWGGAGMERGQWQETLIYSGARFAGDGQALATSFDGTVQLFHLDGPVLRLHRMARFGASSPGEWSE
jgi:hypothetical protein